jgi:tRNA A-37 threonylcarbamoyl transferase component Bud32
VREPLEIGEFRGFRYAELEPRLLERLPRWLAEGRVAEGIDLKRGRVFRWEGLVAKFWRAERRRLRDLPRRSRAVRSADLHQRLLPIATPRPYVALERRAAWRQVERSLLVSEFVAGRRLFEVWREDPRAVAAFPLFLAEMHARGIFHGDFHLENALWNGAAWYLIDLESVRNRLHALFPSKFRDAHWGIVLFDLQEKCAADEPELFALFETYWTAVRGRGSPEATWSRIRRRAQELRADWERRKPIGSP